MNIQDYKEIHVTVTDEEIMFRFFRCILECPDKKDFFIRDFESFYFKSKPRFSKKLVKVMMKVRFSY